MQPYIGQQIIWNGEKAEIVNIVYNIVIIRLPGGSLRCIEKSSVVSA